MLHLLQLLWGFFFQGNDMKKMIKLAANFSKKLKEISEGIKEGVQLFKDIISGKLNLKDIISELVHAIVTLPQKVRTNVCKQNNIRFNLY